MNDCIKICPACGKPFSALDLVYDETVRPIGMCLDEDHRYNFYYFNHEVPDCGTTFIVGVEELHSQIREDIPPEPLTGSPACEGRCLELGDHAPCRAACRFAPFRRLLNYMLQVRGLIPTRSARS